MGPSAKRRKLQNYGVEEVKFDSSARQDYLTGFRKRKLARIQHAQSVAAERERQAKIEERKQLREQRKQEVQDHVKAVNEAVKRAETGGFDSEDDHDSSRQDSDPPEAGVDAENYQPNSEDQSDPAREDQYVDEEKHTTVTVEPMNADSSSEDEDSEGEERTSVYHGFGKPKSSLVNQQHQSKSRSGTQIKPAVKLKTRKPKFHYESKSERKFNKFQQTARKHKAALARRADKRS